MNRPYFESGKVGFPLKGPLWPQISRLHGVSSAVTVIHLNWPSKSQVTEAKDQKIHDPPWKPRNVEIWRSVRVLTPVLARLRKVKQEKFDWFEWWTLCDDCGFCSPSEPRVCICGALSTCFVALAWLIILTAHTIIMEASICVLFRTCKQVTNQYRCGNSSSIPSVDFALFGWRAQGHHHKYFFFFLN